MTSGCGPYRYRGKHNSFNIISYIMEFMLPCSRNSETIDKFVPPSLLFFYFILNHRWKKKSNIAPFDIIVKIPRSFFYASSFEPNDIMKCHLFFSSWRAIIKFDFYVHAKFDLNVNKRIHTHTLIKCHLYGSRTLTSSERVFPFIDDVRLRTSIYVFTQRSISIFIRLSSSI